MIARVRFWPYLVWALATLAYAIAVANRTSLAALGPTAQTHFNIDATALSTFAVMQLVLYTALQIPVGIMVQRYGATLMIFSGAALMTLGQALMAVADEMWLAVLARVLLGAGDAATFISVLRILARWFPVRQLPVWTQITSQLGQAGQLLAVLPLATLVAVSGWMPGFLTAAALTLTGATLVFFLVSDGLNRKTLWQQLAHRPARFVDEPSLHTSGILLDTAVVRAERSLWQDLAFQFRGIPQLLQNPGVRLAWWIHFTTPFSVGMFVFLWGYPFLLGGAGVDEPTATTLLSLSILLALAFGAIMGPLSSRFYRRRELIAVVIVVLQFLAWATVLFWPGQPPLFTLVLLMAVISAGGPASMTSFDVVRASAPKQSISLATGLVNTAGFISLFVAIFGIGFLLDLQGAGTPETYSMEAFRVALSVQVPLWVLGVVLIFRESRRMPKMEY